MDYDNEIARLLFAASLGLCQIAKNKTIATQLKKLRRVTRQVADAEARVIAVQDRAEQMQAALAQREAACEAREREFDEREAEFTSQIGDVRDELREYHNHPEQTHKVLVHRIMSTAGILGEWNWDLQSPPTWGQLRRMVAGLPDDLPVSPTDRIEVQEVREDWTGHTFIADSSLIRTVRGAA
jgi:hypothetical protein